MAKSIIDITDTALDRLGRAIAEVKPEHWRLRTPCPDWDVEALVRHIIDNTRRTITFFDGGSLDETAYGDEFVAAWSRAAENLHAHYAAAGAIDSTLTWGGRRVPVAKYLVQKVGGLAVHTWDVACSIGADDRLDDDVLAVAYEFFVDWVARNGTPTEGGARPFAPPSDAIPDQADLQERVLRLAGRNPASPIAPTAGTAAAAS